MYPILFTFPDSFPLVGGRPLFTYGVLLGLALLAGTALAYRSARRAELPEGRVVATLLIGIIGGLLGARGLFLLLYPAEQRGPESLFRVDAGGMVLAGGLLVGAIAFAIAARALRLGAWKLADHAAPGLALGIVIGRIGCFLYGCDYGRESTSFLAVSYPMWRGDDSLLLRHHGAPAFAAQFSEHASALSDHVTRQVMGLRSLAETVAGQRSPQLQDAWIAFEAKYQALGALVLDGRSVPVLPTQLFEAGSALAAFGVLTWMAPRARFGGQVALALAVWYALTRFGVDFARGDGILGWAGPFSVSQVLGAGIIPIAVGFWWRRSRRAQRRREERSASAA